MNFKAEYDKIQKSLAKQYVKLKVLQEECHHEDLYGKYESNTGNWCSSDDSYWLHLKCNDCGKIWRIEPKTVTKKYRMALFNDSQVVAYDVTDSTLDDPIEYKLRGFLRWIGDTTEVEIEV